MESTNTARPGLIAAWLTVLALLIALMVTVGGATRLTDSGLSITEWDLLMGTLPPLSEAGWAEVFEKYKTIPEYAQVNYGMSLAEFKEIFWWEWGHRNLGRFIGLYVFFPLLLWSVRGTVRGGLRWRLWGLFLLVGLQGAIGWFMVASGLSERVDVSQYRLALHLGTAFILFGLVVWQAVALMRPPGRASGRGGGGLVKLFGVALFAQIILGAFVAGLRAGKTFNTFPLMDGRFVPEGYFPGAAGITHLFESIAAVQFNHRLGAYVIFALAALVLLRLWAAGAKARPYGLAIFLGVFAQFLLGVFTVVNAVPLWLGLAHQFGALALLALTIIAAYDLTPARPRSREAPDSRSAAPAH